MTNKLSKTGITALKRQYKSVLLKCFAINTAVLLLGLQSASASNEAKIGSEEFATLREAIGATASTTGKTIILLKDVPNGEGQFIGVAHKGDFAIDFDGKTYTAYQKSKGSTGTQTQVFHSERGNTIVLKNGTINVANPADATGDFKMGLQNYTNLTLDHMVIDGTNLKGSSPYTMSNNEGKIYIKNSEIIAKEGGVAFDVCDATGKGYTSGTEVNLIDSVVKGKIELDSWGTPKTPEKLNATLNMSGKNQVNGDIYNNKATVNISGDLELNGNMTGNGSTVFAEGSSLTVAANKTSISNNVKNEGATLKLKNEDGYTGSYTLVTGSLDKEFSIAENNLYNIISDESVHGKYEISKKSDAEIANSVSASANEAAVINSATSNMNTGNEVFDSVAKTMNDVLQSGDARQIEEVKDAANALAPQMAPMVQQATTQITNQVFGAVNTRLSSGALAAGRQGMSSGDAVGNNAAVWAQMLYNKSKYDKNAKTKFDSDTKGVTFGLEKYISKSVKVGVGYAYSKTDIDGFKRDVDVKTNTALLYGEYKPNNWFINGIASYSWSDYKEKKYVLSNTVHAKYDVDAYALQTTTGYDLYFNGVEITPEAGLKYVHIKNGSYTDEAGQNISNSDSDILTGILGARINKEYQLDNGVLLTPEFRAAMTYDFVNDDESATVSLANGSVYAVNGDSLKRFGFEIGAGLTSELNDNFELSLGYEGKFRKDYQDHTGLINAKYKF